MENLITTWLDVVQLIPQYFDFETGEFQNVSKARILKAIVKANGIIHSRLRPWYGSDLSIGVNRFQTEVLLSGNNANLDFSIDDAYITVTTQFTQVFKFNFAETSTVLNTVKVDVTPDVGSVQAQEDISGTINLTKISLATGAWSGRTFYKGDTFYLAQYHYETTLVTIATQLAAADVLLTTANSQLSSDTPSAAALKRDAEDQLKDIEDSNDNLLEISLKGQDMDSEAVEYDIDSYGEDQTVYE
jgi:hypothetical protein